MTVFYFTSTGNSLYVAKRIGGHLISIPQAIKEDNKTYKDDSIGFVFPCYGFGVPKIVREFIEKAQFGADYFFAVMTYGNIAANGLVYMQKMMKAKGIELNYAAELLMVDNYLPVYKIEDQLEKEPSKNIEVNLNLILQDVSNKINKKPNKGFGSKFASSIIQSLELFRKSNVDTKFYIDSNCTKCGICKKVCPKGNISIEEKPIYLHMCDFCMGCINLCPQNAIQLKGQRSTARFKNHNVTVKEIIAANGQD